MTFDVTERQGGACFAVRAKTRAKRAGLVGVRDGAIIVAVNAAPVEGAANEAIVSVIAEVLDMARSAVAITSGERSRNKVISVRGLAAAEVRRRLDAALAK